MQALEKFNNIGNYKYSFVSLGPILEKYLYFLLVTSVGSETSILSDLNTVFTRDLFLFKTSFRIFQVAWIFDLTFSNVFFSKCEHLVKCKVWF